MALWHSFYVSLSFSSVFYFYLFVNVYIGACVFIFYLLRTTLFKDIFMFFRSFAHFIFHFIQLVRM